MDRDVPRIVLYLKTDAAYRDVDLHPDVAEFLQRYVRSTERRGLLFPTRNGTPHLHNNIEESWLTPRLKRMGLDEPGMGWHAFRRFRKTQLNGEWCQQDMSNFWMGHLPKTMSELYSHLWEEVEKRLAEARRVGFSFKLPSEKSVHVWQENCTSAPIAPSFPNAVVREVAVID